MTAADTVDICIATPLPSSILLSVGSLLDAAWPGAEIAANHDPRVNQVIFRIPNRPPVQLSAAEAASLVREPDPEGDLEVTRLGPDGAGILTPEALASALLPVIEQAFTEFPDAENYLEIPVFSREAGKRYLLTFSRSAGQTPHELRMQAERKLDRAYADCSAAELTAIHRLLERPRPDGESDSFEAGVKAAMNVIRELSYGRRSA